MGCAYTPHTPPGYGPGDMLPYSPPWIGPIIHHQLRSVRNRFFSVLACAGYNHVGTRATAESERENHSSALSKVSYNAQPKCFEASLD